MRTTASPKEKLQRQLTPCKSRNETPAKKIKNGQETHPIAPIQFLEGFETISSMPKLRRKPSISSKDFPEENLPNIERMNMNPAELLQSSPKFSFGNHQKYYLTITGKKFQDRRLDHVEQSYFKNKECLDIGCNDGSLTLLIAALYVPRHIIGVDIDLSLVEKAIQNLESFKRDYILTKSHMKKEIRAETINPLYSLIEKAHELPVSYKLNLGLPPEIMHAIEKETLPLKHGIPEEQKVIFHGLEDRVSFRVENFIKNIPFLFLKEQFDTIVCFSMTKWVHLNFGDFGIKRLFEKIFALLKPGGHLLLEPHEWRSYKKHTKEFKDVFQTNFNGIKLKPKLFLVFLTSVMHFRLIKKVTPLGCRNSRRPIYILQKPWIRFINGNSSQYASHKFPST